MRRTKIRIGVVFALASLTAALTACSNDASAVSTSAQPVASEGASSGAGWPLPGQNLDNARSAVGSPIAASNIGLLKAVWQVPTPGALTTAALVVGGTAYAEDDQGVVIAVDATTGRVRWRSAPSGFTVGPEGVAVGFGRVYAATPNGVEALDQHTGRGIWVRQLTQVPGEGVDAQPTLVGRRILMATVPVTPAVQYEGGSRGELFAVDAATGRVDWSFDTVKSKTLWGNPAVNSGGGAWYPPAVDPRAGTVYWGTANPAPFVGTTQFPNGSSRPGPNLYTDSTVALDLATGRLRWFHQAVHHDLFDQDFVHAMIVPVDAGSRAVVVGTGKGGQVLAMDPSDGRVLWKTSVGLHENHDLTALSGPTTILPGTYGGVLTPPASADGTAYLAVINAPSVLSPDKTAYFGGKIGTMNGELVAINAATGKVRWTTSIPGDPTGGATVVNDLVITATFQGQMVAVKRSTGRIVSTTAVGSAVSGWPAVAGNLVVVPTGSVASPGRLVAYRLG